MMLDFVAVARLIVYFTLFCVAKVEVVEGVSAMS